MNMTRKSWDYLILTASNQTQARFYRTQLDLRRKLGLLSGVKQYLVVPDPQGQRIGSGGSTILSLLKVVNRESPHDSPPGLTPSLIENTLSRLRILIIHAGGDSRRMPAYGPSGKIFTPLPAKFGSVLGNTIFDRQFPIYRDLPLSPSHEGQVVITTGDVLLFFSSKEVKFQGKGAAGLSCAVSPGQAQNHGVFVTENRGEVCLFLQKPSVSEQKKYGAVNAQGKTLLDIGVIELNAAAATKLMNLVKITKKKNEFNWTGPKVKEIQTAGLDFYRDICCAMGKKVGFDDYIKNVRSSGSGLSESFLRTIFSTMSKVPFHVHPIKKCTFLHFGTPRQLIETGSKLKSIEKRSDPNQDLLSINNHISDNGQIKGTKSWVEGCRIDSELKLEGENVVVGVDVDKPLSLKEKTCLDIIKGKNQKNKSVWFVRIYHLDDSFKAPIHKNVLSPKNPLIKWLYKIGDKKKSIWEKKLKPSEKTLWNAKIFPAVSSPHQYSEWLWMADPFKATKNQIQAWHRADRYSLEDMVHLVDLEDFYQRRQNNRIKKVFRRLTQVFQPQNPFSAQDLELIFENLDEKNRVEWICDILSEACRYLDKHKKGSKLDPLIFSRAVHSLGTAVKHNLSTNKKKWNQTIQNAWKNTTAQNKKCLFSMGLDSSSFQEAETWYQKIQESAFENLSQTIVRSQKKSRSYPRCSVRSDAIIWGRAPARLDLGGGGFLLVVAKSPQDAEKAKKALTKHPPNPLARFFDFETSATGLEITVC